MGLQNGGWDGESMYEKSDDVMFPEFNQKQAHRMVKLYETNNIGGLATDQYAKS
jgi:hypothetical protein